MRTAVGVWRWRRNPLRRRTDLVEAWVALAAVVCLFVAAPAVGWVTGSRVGDTLQQASRRQHEERRMVAAVVVRPAKEPPAAPGAEPAARQESGPYPQVFAEWTAPDGSAHTGAVAAVQETPRPGDRLRIWTDAHGRLVPRPLDSATAASYAALAGLAAAVALATLVDTVRRLVVRRLMHRRYARLDRAWAAAGPDWGRADAGS
ncbi:Rv1733c family protein [Streptomyces sp. 12297]|uniref:Rv1733c family protein n=1 Tax=Streptomyces sp. NBC_00239 TaxID=2903640 RepID=UPI003254EFA8